MCSVRRIGCHCRHGALPDGLWSAGGDGVSRRRWGELSARYVLLASSVGAGSVARWRSGGVGRVLHEGGVLLEEGRGY